MTKRFSARLAIVFLAMAVVATILSGCGPTLTSPGPGVPEVTPEPKTQDTTVTLYFVGQDGERLVPETRTVPNPGRPIAEIVVEELIKGPVTPGSSKTIPAGTKLLSLEVANGVAVVNFSGEIVKNHWGGSTGEAQTLNSVVYSLTVLPGIEKVQFLVDGDKVETLAGHYTLTEPIGRQMLKLPLWFAGPNAYLYKEQHFITIFPGEKVEAIFSALLSGPDDTTLKPAVPNRTQLLGYSTDFTGEGAVVTLNLSRDFLDNMPTGDTSELLAVYSIVDTLTQPEADIHAVKFLVDGKPIDMSTYNGMLAMNSTFTFNASVTK